MGYVVSMGLIENTELARFTEGHPEWEISGREMVRTFAFDDFNGSMAFVNRVAESAEAASHHPDIDIRWNRVILTLSTHSEGGLTQKDIDLATEIDGMA